MIYSRSFFLSHDIVKAKAYQRKEKDVFSMEQLLETLATELSSLGDMQKGVDFELTCGRSRAYVIVYKKDDTDDRAVLKVINRYSAFKPNISLVTTATIAFMLYGEFELGEYVRDVGLERKGDIYLASTTLVYNNETIKVVDEIINREPTAKFELSQVVGDEVLIEISEVDVTEAFKQV